MSIGRHGRFSAERTPVRPPIGGAGDVAPLPEDAKAVLREQDPDWAYNSCCGEPFNCGGCIIDQLTGA